MKKLIIALALVLTAGTALAQNETKLRWAHFETNRFIDNWELSVDAGAQTMFVLPGTKDNYDLNPEGFGKDFTFAVDAALTKWITPIVGVRFGWAGLNYTNYYESVLGHSYSDTNMNHYFTIHADLMFNLTNWICGYKADRFYNAIFFAGVGYGSSRLNDDCSVAGNHDGNYFSTHNQEWMVPMGLINRFRLCDAWSINLELRDLIVRNAFSNYGDNVNGNAKSQFGAANILSLTAGVTYKFKNRGFNAYEPIDKSLYDNRIASLERDLQNEKDQNAEYQKQLERYKKALDEETRAKNEALARAAKNNPVMANDDVTLSIFFPLGSAKISDKNQINIQYMADVIKASNSDKVYTITGYADKSTGSENRNLKLSQERAEAVCKALVAAGVDSKKVKVDYKGCSVQPFEKDYLNRVAIIK